MKHIWFKKIGWLYKPVSWLGGLFTIFLILFLINVFIAVDRQSHSVSDTFYGIFPYYLPVFLFWLWLGEKTSE